MTLYEDKNLSKIQNRSFGKNFDDKRRKLLESMGKKKKDTEQRLESKDSIQTNEMGEMANSQYSLEGAEENKTEQQECNYETQIKQLEDQWKKQYDEINDKYLRLAAEFDNYRKRTLKERMELIKTGGEDVLKGILPVVDDFERALKTIEGSNDLEAVKTGIMLIYSKFSDFLRQKGVVEIEAMHCDFEIDKHEAITKIPAPTNELKGKVVDVLKKGYLLHDKVLRYAQVVVGE